MITKSAQNVLKILFLIKKHVLVCAIWKCYARLTKFLIKICVNVYQNAQKNYHVLRLKYGILLIANVFVLKALLSVQAFQYGVLNHVLVSVLLQVSVTKINYLTINFVNVSQTKNKFTKINLVVKVKNIPNDKDESKSLNNYK